MKHHKGIYSQRPRRRSSDLANILAVLFLLAVGFTAGVGFTLWLTYNAWYLK